MSYKIVSKESINPSKSDFTHVPIPIPTPSKKPNLSNQLTEQKYKSYS